MSKSQAPFARAGSAGGVRLRQSWRHTGRASRWRPWRVVLALLLVGIGLVVLVRPARIAAETLVLMPALFPEVPLDPLSLVTPAPLQEESRFSYAAGTVDVDVYRPAVGGPHGGVVLQLGARFEQRDPVLVRFARGLARLGVVVVVPGSSSLSAGRILPEETDALDKSFDLLTARSDVDPARTGFLGFSVGGGLSLLAASHPPLRDRVHFVSSLGGYEDARRLLVDVASRSVEVDGTQRTWDPNPLTLEVLATQIVETLPAEQDRDLLGQIFLHHETVPEGELEGLTPGGRDARALLQGTDRATAAAIVARLPDATRARLAGISPAGSLSDLRADLYLMHDVGDSYIPFTETRHLAADAPPGVVRQDVETAIFEHVYPDKPVPWTTFLPEVWRLFWYAHAVLMELL